MTTRTSPSIPIASLSDFLKRERVQGADLHAAIFCRSPLSPGCRFPPLLIKAYLLSPVKPLAKQMFFAGGRGGMRCCSIAIPRPRRSPAPARVQAVWPDRLFLVALVVLCGLGGLHRRGAGGDLWSRHFLLPRQQLPGFAGTDSASRFPVCLGTADLLDGCGRAHARGPAAGRIGVRETRCSEGSSRPGAWWLARRRLSAIAACAIGIYTLLLMVAPFSLGYGSAQFQFRDGLQPVRFLRCSGSSSWNA